jgi:tetratricopeptide (TPR) repeat protein
MELIVGFDLKNSIVYMRLGLARLKKHDYTGAIADLTEVIKINSQFATAYSLRGEAYLKRRNYPNAINDYEEAIRLDPGLKPQYAHVYSERGTVYLKGGLYDEAIADFLKAKELRQGAVVGFNSPYAHAHYERGMIRHAKQDYDGAIDDYTEAIRLSSESKYIVAYFKRADARKDKGDLDGAITGYTEVIQSNPFDPLFYTGNNDAVDKRKVVASISEYVAAYNNRGKLQYDKGKLNEAIRDFMQPSRFDPKYVPDPTLAQACVQRGNERKDKGDLEGAKSDYEMALSINPNFEEAKKNLEGLRQKKHKRLFGRL